jgi:2-polyprenyl-3-methyl-5-hydroxy-6-metoxy-1,4-benzoquinol methylase
LSKTNQSEYKAEFWEKKFSDERTAWGFEPADSAVYAKNLFLEKKKSNILIPGIGYGRNAKIFIDSGIKVTGIEISKTAIGIAKKENGLKLQIHHGSVTDMPFDTQQYDGIFCYALIHLLNKPERKEFLKKCYSQLATNGIMIFTVISKKSAMFGQGRLLSKARFKIGIGLNVFFYDAESVKKEFGNYGLIECREFDEPIKHMRNEPPLKCLLVTCKRT